MKIEVPLAPVHKGMKVSARGLLGRIAKGEPVNKVDRYVLGELLEHLLIVEQRFYTGDILVVDELLQFYGLDEHRPKESE